MRACYVAFGDTGPRARAIVHGVPERGRPGKAWDARTGRGHVTYQQGAYERAEQRHGVDVRALLFEVWGGWSPGVVELWRQTAEERGDKLRRAEYDDTSWAARTWSAYAAQRVSCALQRGIAFSVARELEISTARDPRDDAAGAA